MSSADVVVIGGTSGIGLATVERLAADGYGVHAVGEEECDVRFPRNIQSLVDDNLECDKWVYSAGVNRLSYIHEQPEDSMMDLYDVNVLGFLRLMATLDTYRDGANGTSVVAVGSDAAERPMRTSTVYCGTKAALHMSVRCLARELAPSFRVNAVAPGMTEPTQMQEYIDAAVPRIRGWSEEEAREYERSQIPMVRRGQVEEVAEVIVSTLLGPDYLTGSIITINGGR